MTHTITIRGHVPSKKNNWRGGRGRVFIPTSDRAAIDAITTQIRCEWRTRPALVAPRISAQFIVRDGRGDLDNKWTTVQDCLVEGGVLINDSIARLPGPITIEAGVGEPEMVVVQLDAPEVRHA